MSFSGLPEGFAGLAGGTLLIKADVAQHVGVKAGKALTLTTALLHPGHGLKQACDKIGSSVSKGANANGLGLGFGTGHFGLL